MAVSNVAAFAQFPRTAIAIATGAFNLSGTNSILDELPANTVKLLTAGADGALLTSVKALPRATNTATMAALFLRKSTDAAGTRRLLNTITLPAQTVAATSKVQDYAFDIASEAAPFRLAAGDEIYVGLAVAQTNGVNFVGAFVDF